MLRTITLCYNHHRLIWRYRLGVRTEDSQSSNPGSIPGSATIPFPCFLTAAFRYPIDRGLRSALRESECGCGHRNSDLRADYVSCMQVLEFEDQGWSRLLSSRDQQDSVGTPHFLLNDHTWRKQF